MKGTLFLASKTTDLERQFDFPLPGIGPVESALAGHREGARNEISVFKKAWEEDYANRLQLSAALLELESVLVSQPALTPKQGATAATGVIWTLSTGIDRLSDELSDGNLSWALFLDIVATFLLIRLHDFLLAEVAPRTGLLDAGSFREYYPGYGAPENSVIPLIADRAIAAGFPAQRTERGTLSPKKTQCTLLLRGVLPPGKSFPKIPCGSCTGAKCVFHQTGSCHMGEK